MSKVRYSIFFGIAFLLTFSTCSSPKHHPDKKRPNIVLIVIDDLGWSDLGCYGADLHETPNIDRFAKEGTLFKDFYAAAPVCSPTRASIMTGKYPARLNFTIWSEAASPSERKNQEVYRFLPPKTRQNLPLDEVTIAEMLKKKGYYTAHIGKWHIGDLMHFPETQGFDVSIAASQRGATPTFFYPYKGMAYGELRFVGGLGADKEGHYITDRTGEYLTDRLTDEAVKIIQDAGDKPFYLNLWYYSVHTPIEGKEKDVEHFKGRLKPGMKHNNPEYAAMAKAVDDNVGRVLEAIEKTGMADNTVIFITSDNGGYINEYKGNIVTNNYPLRSGKGSLFEGGVRIPFMAQLPGNRLKGKTVDVPLSTIDIFPTIMDIVGISGYPAIDGKSFAPLLYGKEMKDLNKRTLYWHYPHYYATTTPVSSVRDGKWKLIEFLEDGHVELYDLSTDIGEKHDLSKEMPEQTEQLLKELKEWKKDVNAKGITPNPNFKQ